ncbi:hypothetical protein DVR12_20585 [Chitinophaga silvatica]|uniref:Bacterial Pleckstrin homology domain-containing protein n=1 Tax=Chitinophaga silvatica TaxID=2282649 RepID=A0A3E1Y5V3_9BACT|nr:PH domain-containing protein [Chitinophaga silvatica]RFS20116.1 hypothetical protein DVR12_20585 [Chitinophaga silvatica]
MKYSARYDTLTKVITIIVIIFVVSLFVLIISSKPGNTVPGNVALIILAVSILVTFGYSPRYYSITEDAIIIKRIFSDISIPFEDVVNISIIEKSAIRGSLRVFGSGGLFGYLGIFRSSNLGKYQMWSTNCETLVLIECMNKKIVISPSDNNDFIEEFNRKKKPFS